MTAAALLLSLTTGLAQDVSRIPGQPFRAGGPGREDGRGTGST